MELLCAIGIISILAALFLGVIPAAIGRAKRLSHGIAAGQTNIINSINDDK